MKSGDVEEKRSLGRYHRSPPAQQTPGCLLFLCLHPLPSLACPGAHLPPPPPRASQPNLHQGPSEPGCCQPTLPHPDTLLQLQFPTASFLVTMLLVVMSLTCPRDSVVPAEGPPPPHTPLSTRPRRPQIHIKHQPAPRVSPHSSSSPSLSS